MSKNLTITNTKKTFLSGMDNVSHLVVKTNKAKNIQKNISGLLSFDASGCQNLENHPTSDLLVKLVIPQTPISNIRLISYRTLNHLNIASTKITQLPGQLPSLRYLNISNCDIAKLPKIDNIRKLVIPGSNVEKLPNKLPRLEHLDICDTQVSLIPRCDKLVELYCCHSKVEDISHLTSLRELMIIGTSIDRLPDADFTHIIALKKINFVKFCPSLVELLVEDEKYYASEPRFVSGYDEILSLDQYWDEVKKNIIDVDSFFAFI